MPLHKKIRSTLIALGLSISLPFFAWFVLGYLPNIPTMLDIFGVSGIRIPAGITILGLLLAAIGAEEF